MYPDVPLIFVNTGLEYDSVRLKGIELADQVLRPKMNFADVIIKYGYPIISKEIAQALHDVTIQAKRNGCEKRSTHLWNRSFNPNSDYSKKYPQFSKSRYDWLNDAPFLISHKCCDVMKKHPAKMHEKTTGQKPFIGTLATESRLRKTKWLKHGCNAFEEKRPTSQPLSFWTENDILQYIIDNQLSIADVYGDVVYYDKNGEYSTNPFGINMDLKTTGAPRTGCVFCMFGITQDPNRFLRLKEIEPLKYDYVMRGGKFDESGMWIPAPDENGKMGLGYKFVIDWLNEHGNLNIKY